MTDDINNLELQSAIANAQMIVPILSSNTVVVGWDRRLKCYYVWIHSIFQSFNQSPVCFHECAKGCGIVRQQLPQHEAGIQQWKFICNTGTALQIVYNAQGRDVIKRCLARQWDCEVSKGSGKAYLACMWECKARRDTSICKQPARYTSLIGVIIDDISNWPTGS